MSNYVSLEKFGFDNAIDLDSIIYVTDIHKEYIQPGLPLGQLGIASYSFGVQTCGEDGVVFHIDNTICKRGRKRRQQLEDLHKYLLKYSQTQ